MVSLYWGKTYYYSKLKVKYQWEIFVNQFTLKHLEVKHPEKGLLYLKRNINECSDCARRYFLCVPSANGSKICAIIFAKI